MVQISILSYMLRSRSSSGEHRIEREKGEKPERKREAISDAYKVSGEAGIKTGRWHIYVLYLTRDNSGDCSQHFYIL